MICFATAGTALIWICPWGQIFPLEAMITSMNWGARLEWVIAIEIVTALVILPFFAVLLRLWGTFGWADLLRVFFISAMLFTAGDVPTIWWNVNHPVVSRSQATWVIPMMLGWIFFSLLLSARAACRLPSPASRYGA
jgi:hypothetical protein